LGEVGRFGGEEKRFGEKSEWGGVGGGHAILRRWFVYGPGDMVHTYGMEWYIAMAVVVVVVLRLV